MCFPSRKLHLCMICLLIYSVSPGSGHSLHTQDRHDHEQEKHNHKNPVKDQLDESDRNGSLLLKEKTNSHDNSGVTVDYFLDELMRKYGNGISMSFEGFEHLLQKLNLANIVFLGHSLECHRANNSSDFIPLHTHHNHSEEAKVSSDGPCPSGHHEHPDHDGHDHHSHEQNDGQGHFHVHKDSQGHIHDENEDLSSHQHHEQQTNNSINKENGHKDGNSDHEHSDHEHEHAEKLHKQDENGDNSSKIDHEHEDDDHTKPDHDHEDNSDHDHGDHSDHDHGDHTDHDHIDHSHHDHEDHSDHDHGDHSDHDHRDHDHGDHSDHDHGDHSDHDHGDHDHGHHSDHDHGDHSDHDHESHSDHDHGDHSDHDHGDHSDHDHESHSDHDHGDHSDHDHGDHSDHDHESHSDHDHGDHSDHDHGDHSDHDHGDHSDHDHGDHSDHDHEDHSDHDHGDNSDQDHEGHSDHDHGDHSVHDHGDHSGHNHKNEHGDNENVTDSSVHDHSKDHAHNHTDDHEDASHEGFPESKKEIVRKKRRDSVSEDECLPPKMMLDLVDADISQGLTREMFLSLCPALIYQIDADLCHIHHHDHDHSDNDHLHHDHDHHDHEHHEVSKSTEFGISAKVWGFSTIAVVIISLVGLFGVAVIPIVQKVFYNHLLQFLVALAVGALSGDALLHLLPHAIAGGHAGEAGEGDGHNHGSHGDGSHKHDLEPIYKGLCGLLGIYFFFLTERILTIVTDMKRRKKKKKNRSRYLNEDEDLEKVGEKLANTDMECDEMMLSIHPNKALKGYADETHNEHCAISLSNTTAISHQHGHRHQRKDDKLFLEEDVAIISHSSNGHGHGHSHCKDGVPKSISAIAWMVILGDGIHNLSDGLAIGAAFANSITGGFSTSVAVFCHELPHEIGDFAMLLRAGMSPKQAIIYNCVSSILCFIGMVIGVAIGNIQNASLWIFAVVAGMFLYIALVDMLPEMSSVDTKKGEHPFFHLFLQLLGMMIGAGIMLLIALYEEDLITIFD